MPSPITGIVTAINKRRPDFMSTTEKKEMLSLKSQQREVTGKGPMRRLRVSHLVPGVFYNDEGKNISIQMEKLPLEKLYNKVRRTTVFNLEIDNNGKTETYPVVVWDVQHHPTKQSIVHIDFFGVDLNKDIQLTVPLEFVGVSKGAKAGGKLETYREQMRLSAKPQDIPAKVSIDISNLDLNKTIRASGVELPENVRAVYKSDYAIISCLDPKGLAAANSED